MKKALLGLLFAISLFALPASASTFYVRSTTACPTNGNGTSSSCATTTGGAGAWSGFSNIVWGSIHAGDTLNLVAGDTYTGQLTIQSSGSLGNPITISSTGASATIDAQNTNSGINWGGQAFVTVNGLVGNAAFGGSTSYGIRIINLGVDRYCSYMNNGEHDVKALHIECSGTVQSGTTDYTGGFYAAGMGAQVSSTQLEIAYNWVHGPAPTSGGGTAICFVTDRVNANQLWCATGIKTFPPLNGTGYTNTLIHDNRIANLYNDGIDSGHNTSMYHNEVSGIQNSGHSDSLQIESGNYSQIYSNYVHDSNDQNCYLDNHSNATTGHLRIYNNIFNSPLGFGGCIIDPEGPSGGGGVAWDDIVIANNTFYQSNAYGVYWSRRGTVSNLVILNNIFGQMNMGPNAYYPIYLGSAPTFASSTAWDYDVYSSLSNGYPIIANWSTGNFTLAQLQALSPARETHGKIGTPTYVSPSTGNFHLAGSDTVASTSGQNLTGTYAYLTTDFDGNTRPAIGAWANGAYIASGSPGPPVLVFTPSPVNFGSVNIGNSSTITVNVANTGGTTETISSIVVSGSGYSNTGAGTCSTSILVGSSCTVTVKFQPTVSGSSTGSLTINGTVTGSATLNGTGQTVISIPGTPPNVATTVSGTTANTTWGNSVGTPTGYKVQRATALAGPYTLIATLGLTNSYADNGLANGTYCYQVAAFNTAGTSAFSPGVCVVIATAPAATLTNTVVTFGAIVENITSGTQIVNVQSTGTANLVLASSNAVTLSGANAADFSISATTCTNNLTLVPGTLCTITLTFTPSTVGPEVASLVVVSNDPNSPDTASLSGTGVAAIVISPTSINFGNQFLNKASAAHAVTFTNNSGSTVNFVSVLLTTGTQFSISSNSCSGALTTGNSCTTNLKFTPTSQGSKVDTLTYTFTGAGTSPQTVSLSGTGKRHGVLKVGAAVNYRVPHGYAILRTLLRPWKEEFADDRI